jgi:crotonobetainyl-CoA:carnitine CoA-transferase CaiB-like acyl-CoA transferase
MSGGFLNLNRNKRSVCLDLKQPACREALDQLIRGADAFVHNLRPAVMARLGYGYEQVKALKPDIVYCAAHGFGSDGPCGDKAAYDDIIQATSGLAALFEHTKGEPTYVPTVVCDKLTGQAIAYAVLAALLHRLRGGGGQQIEAPMFETSVEFNLVEHMGGLAFRPPEGPAGFPRVLNPQRKPYRTRDGHICLLPYSDRNWADFFAFTGRRELEGDPRFATLADRARNIGDLYRMVEEEAAKRTTAEWVAFCDGANIPCAPVMRFDDLPEDLHVRAVGLFQDAVHPTEGPYRVIRPSIRFGGHDFEVIHHAPRHGEHTAEVLREAGLSAAKVDEIVKSTQCGALDHEPVA